MGDDLDKLIDVHDIIVQLKKAVTTLGESSATTNAVNVQIIFTEGSEQAFQLLNKAIDSMLNYVLRFIEQETEEER